MNAIAIIFFLVSWSAFFLLLYITSRTRYLLQKVFYCFCVTAFLFGILSFLTVQPLYGVSIQCACPMQEILELSAAMFFFLGVALIVKIIKRKDHE